MNDTRTHNDAPHRPSRLRRWGRRALLALAALGLLAAAARLSLRTDLVRGWVRAELLNQVNERLNGTFSAGPLEGDLWKEARLSGLRLEAAGGSPDEPLFLADSLVLRYDLLSLLSPEFLVRELRLAAPRLHLRAEGDGWNADSLLRPDDTASGGFGFNVEDLSVRRGRVEVLRAGGLPDGIFPDSSMTVSDLEVRSAVRFGADSWHVDLRELAFSVQGAIPGDSLMVEAAAGATDGRITLERLLLATGGSLVRSSGSVVLADSSADLAFRARPLLLDDLRRIASLPVAGDSAFDVELSLEGTLSQFTVRLSASSRHLRGMDLEGDLSWGEEPVLERIRLEVDQADLAALTGDTALPALNNLLMEAGGRMPLQRHRESSLQGSLRMGATRIPGTSHTADTLGGTFRLEGATATANLSARMGAQSLLADLRLDELWSPEPAHRLTAQVSGADPGYWLEDPGWKGGTNLELRTSGRGWMPGETPWNYELRLAGLSLPGNPTPPLEGTLKGAFTLDSVQVDARLRSGPNTVGLQGSLAGFASGEPRFRYQARSRGLNLSAFAGLDDFPTDLNMQARGEGSGATLERLVLRTEVEIDSSVVNGELIRRFTASVRVEDTVAVVREATLSSTIATGEMDGRMHLVRPYDPGNELNVEMELIDPHSLAPLAGARSLFATGTLSGRLYPATGRELAFDGSVDLRQVNYDSTFAAERANGNVEVIMGMQTRYNADLQLTSPVIASVLLQDLHLESRGRVDSTRAAGSFQLRFSSTTDGVIVHAGEYEAAPDSLALLTTRYDLQSSVRTLSLERPFRMRYHDGTVRMDTMRLVSEVDDAFVELAVPYADSLRQEVWLRGRELNTTVIQNTLLGETLFEATLSGELRVSRSDTSMQGGGNLVLSDFSYRDTGLDTLELDFNIAGERFDGNLSMRNGGNELVRGELHAPFNLQDPSTLSDRFFQQEVEGYLEVNSVDLDWCENLLAEAGITGTSGIFNFRGTLTGTAGDPDFQANAVLDRAVLSGVSVDSVQARLDYSHRLSRVTLDASVSSLGQTAAEITARAPFYVDFRELTANFPQPRDSVEVDVVTNNFNMAALNDFVDRRTVREIGGELNGMLHVNGRVEDLQARGQLNFRNGNIRLVDAGIRVDRIGATLDFERDSVVLRRFSARSGNGTLRANGAMNLEQLRPGEMDVSITARNFRAANTSRYNASVNLDARARGTPGSPRVSGTLEVLNGFIMMDNFGERSVEAVQLDSTDMVDYSVALYDSLGLDMDVRFNRRFFVRNRRYMDMELELQGEVDLLKEPGQPMQIFGSLSSVGGYARPLGKRFNLEEGMLTFSGDPYNPEINVRTLYELPQDRQDIRIWYVIEGTVEDPQFKYESAPPMELQNIISYTLFGQPFYALDSWKQVVAGTGSNASATDVALDVLLDRVESLATRQLGIDVVQIDNTRVGGESGTAITTGWYLNPRVFFAIQNVITDATPDTSFLLEYLLRKNLKLIISQGNDSRQGIDLKWNYDY